MKRTFDVVLAIVLLIFLGLPILVIALIIKATSKGPAIVREDRIGYDNFSFLVPMFRTSEVKNYCEYSSFPVDSGNSSTPLCRFLIKHGLDKLPQLWSVLKGDMSFVGPEPLSCNRSDLIELRTEKGIHMLVPGMSGLAQINNGQELTSRMKVEYDEYYMKNMSLSLDLKIMLTTVIRAIRK